MERMTEWSEEKDRFEWVKDYCDEEKIDRIAEFEEDRENGRNANYPKDYRILAGDIIRRYSTQDIAFLVRALRLHVNETAVSAFVAGVANEGLIRGEFGGRLRM